MSRRQVPLEDLALIRQIEMWIRDNRHAFRGSDPVIITLPRAGENDTVAFETWQLLPKKAAKQYIMELMRQNRAPMFRSAILMAMLKDRVAFASQNQKQALHLLFVTCKNVFMHVDGFGYWPAHLPPSFASGIQLTLFPLLDGSETDRAKSRRLRASPTGNPALKGPPCLERQLLRQTILGGP